MPSPESLVRLRPWLLRLLLLALTVLAALALISLLIELLPITGQLVGLSSAVTMLACAGSLVCIDYSRRRERTVPAVVGLALLVLATAAAQVEIWQNDEMNVLPISRVLAAWATAWTFALAVLSVQLTAKQALWQWLTAVSMAGMAAILTLKEAHLINDHRDEWLNGVLWIAAASGCLLVIALGYLRRSGVRALVPMVHVANVQRSADFYKQLGFRRENSFTPPQASEPTWAWMETPGGAQLMLVCAEEPVMAAQQGVLFYVYCDDLPAKHAELTAKGLEVGLIERPFYAPRGECRLKDADGYVLMLTHT